MCTTCKKDECKCDTSFPADWAIDEALKRGPNGQGGWTSIDKIKSPPNKDHFVSHTVLALARMIEKYEERPVPEELKAAREFAVQSQKYVGATEAKRYRNGFYDLSSDHIKDFLAGVDWAEARRS